MQVVGNLWWVWLGGFLFFLAIFLKLQVARMKQGIGQFSSFSANESFIQPRHHAPSSQEPPAMPDPSQIVSGMTDSIGEIVATGFISLVFFILTLIGMGQRMFGH